MKKYTLWIAYSLCLPQFLLLACNKRIEKDRDFLNIVKIIRNSRNTFSITRIPNGSSTGLYEQLRDWSGQLKLKPVDTVSTDFEFRVWLDMPGTVRQQRLFILRENKGVFSAELVRFRLNWWEHRHQVFVMTSDTKGGVPKNSWDSFAKKMFMPGFLLPFDLNIKNTTSGGTDGSTFCFELISNNHY